MGGLTAALRLVRHGYRVTVLEARDGPGGLAGAAELDGFRFDAGPYILLDRPGLEWAFRAVGLDLAAEIPLRRVDDVYSVAADGAPPVTFHADPARTADAMERSWPGSGRRYRDFVTRTGRAYARLTPLQHVSRPTPWTLLRTGAWRHVPFLFRSLKSVMAGTGLPGPVVDAVAIWTHVAGQTLAEAPSPLAFVPALIHGVGSYYPPAGIGSIPVRLAEVADKAGVRFRYGTKVRKVRRAGGRVVGVETEAGEGLAAVAVVSNAAGVGTYLDLLDDTPPAAREKLARLPLQSPGVCAYLAVRGGPAGGPYLRFRLPPGGERCRCLVRPAMVEPGLVRADGWEPARLIAPMPYELAEAGGPDGQRAYLDRLLAEDWWRPFAPEFRLLATRIPAEWGRQYHLYRESMNPVMTAAFMRAGRLAHRSPHARGLYLAGSATHPGQWVSFCAVSGVLAADRLREDLPP
jgi:phytoene desaturase